MDIVLIFLGLLALSSTALFLVFQPRVVGHQRRALKAFNACLFVIVLFVCGMFMLLMHSNYAIPEDQFSFTRPEQRNLWLTLGLGGSFAIATLFFFIGWLARNFWIFKPPRLSRRPW